MKFINHNPKQLAKQRRMLAKLWVIFALGYIALAILGKKQRLFFIFMSITYVLLALFALHMVKRTENKNKHVK
jgi:quinol-cytochrome oxidoreductase complex cytochrome b subunit